MTSWLKRIQTKRTNCWVDRRLKRKEERLEEYSEEREALRNSMSRTKVISTRMREDILRLDVGTNERLQLASQLNDNERKLRMLSSQLEHSFQQEKRDRVEIRILSQIQDEPKMDYTVSDIKKMIKDELERSL